MLLSHCQNSSLTTHNRNSTFLNIKGEEREFLCFFWRSYDSRSICAMARISIWFLLWLSRHSDAILMSWLEREIIFGCLHWWGTYVEKGMNFHLWHVFFQQRGKIPHHGSFVVVPTTSASGGYTTALSFKTAQRSVCVLLFCCSTLIITSFANERTNRSTSTMIESRLSFYWVELLRSYA